MPMNASAPIAPMTAVADPTSAMAATSGIPRKLAGAPTAVNAM
jgi:hypothetical protein